MAVSIGKRKRQEEADDSDNNTEDEDAARALFQRAFEAKFKPLARSVRTVKKLELDLADESEKPEDESEWNGLSDDEEPVETIQHGDSQHMSGDTQRLERKAFMSSKPPTSNTTSGPLAKDKQHPSDPDPTEPTNLKNDLALQRLLKESHLLHPNPGTFSGTTPPTTSKTRLKSLDLRLQDLGAKAPVSQQRKMPLAHRRGIVAKAADREGRRRREAVENGVVLEKAKQVSKGAKFRERGVGGPSVGRFKGAMLKLSGRDLRDIEGVGGSGDRGRRRG